MENIYKNTEPRAHDKHTMHAMEHFKKREYLQTIEECTKSIKLSQTNTIAYIMRAESQRQMGNIKEALEDYSIASDLVEKQKNEEHALLVIMGVDMCSITAKIRKGIRGE